MIDAQSQSATFDNVNGKENDDNLNEFDDLNVYGSPDDLLNELNDNVESLKVKSAKIEFEIKERGLNSKISTLENKVILAEEENIKLQDRIEQIENDLRLQKSMNEQYQSSLNQSKHDYSSLVSKLLLSFNCHSIDEIFKISDKIIEMESKIDHLSKNLEQAQIQLSEISVNSIEKNTINTTDMTLSSFSAAKQEEMDKLARQLKRSNEKISMKNQEIEILKSKIADIKQNNEKIQSKYSQIRASSSNFESENQELQLSYKQLSEEFNEFKSQQSKELSEKSKRFKILDQISKRLEPKFLLIKESNVLYPIFDNLSMLLQGISDMEIDSQAIVQGLMEISNVIQKAINDIDQSLAVNQSSIANSEEIAQLKSQISDYEDQIERLQTELNEMLEDDSSSELITWMKKYKDLEQELISIKQSQAKFQALNQSLNFS